MVIESLYDIGDEVYLKTDIDQFPRIVVGILYRSTGVSYQICSGTSDYWAAEVELTLTKEIY